MGFTNDMVYLDFGSVLRVGKVLISPSGYPRGQVYLPGTFVDEAHVA